jgi:hypothetical protein
MHRIAFVGRSEERSDMLSDTRVVSNLIVESSPYGARSVDTTPCAKTPLNSMLS